MKKLNWIDFMNNLPDKKRPKYWALEILPSVTILSEDQGPTLYISWLFWGILIYLPPWE